MNRIPDTLPYAQPMGRVSPLRVVAALCLLALGACILAFAMTADKAANRDFICYWSAGQQLVHHGNPYDGAAILGLERATGFQPIQPFFTRNPHQYSFCRCRLAT